MHVNENVQTETMVASAETPCMIEKRFLRKQPDCLDKTVKCLDYSG